MFIRVALPADLDAARKVQSAAFAANRAVYRPKATARPIFSGTEPDIVGLVAIDADAVVGTTCYWLVGDECHVGAVAVEPQARGRGVARGLIEHVESLGRQNGWNARVASTVRQAGQVGFYERLGFVVVQECEPTWCESTTSEPVTEVNLRKPLR